MAPAVEQRLVTNTYILTSILMYSHIYIYFKTDQIHKKKHGATPKAIEEQIDPYPCYLSRY